MSDMNELYVHKCNVYGSRTWDDEYEYEERKEAFGTDPTNDDLRTRD